MRNFFITIAFSLLALLLVSCNSGGGDSSTPPPTQTTGQFIDDKVQGLNYHCSSGTTDVTDSNGNYTCKIGDDVTFKVGDATIGTLAAQSDFFTPYSFYPTSLEASLNLASLLQSLDSDGDDTNGIIVIDSALAGKLSADTNFLSPTFKIDTEADLGIVLISHTEAQRRLNTNIEDNGGTVPVGGEMPVADAGLNQSAHIGDTVTLNGSGSYDTIQRELTYKWCFIIKPTNSTAVLSDSSIVNPTFTADIAGEYVVALIVNNGECIVL
jgi:hypothetical protein